MDTLNSVATCEGILNGEKVIIKRNRYAVNDNLAIMIETPEGEPVAILTKNLNKKLPENMAFLDVNNFPDAERFVADNKLGWSTGMYRNSGFCVYPLYEFY